MKLSQEYINYVKKRMRTIKKYNIEWNFIKHTDDDWTIDYLYCFQGESTRESTIRMYKITFQYPTDERAASIDWDSWNHIFQAEYFLLYELLYHKQTEEYDPYGDQWYMNYTSLSGIANDYSFARVFTSFEQVEEEVNGRVNLDAYLLSHITDSPEEAREAAGRTKILGIAPHENRLPDDTHFCRYGGGLEDIAWYFKEFSSSIGILSMRIKDGRICMNLDRGRKAVFQIRNGRGYLEHWDRDDKEGTMCTATIFVAQKAVKWLLLCANHELPLHDKYAKYNLG